MAKYLDALIQKMRTADDIGILLPAVKAFEGSAFELGVPQRGNENVQTVYYGCSPAMIGEHIGKDTELEYALDLYCPVLMVLDLPALLKDGKVEGIFPFDPEQCEEEMKQGDFSLEISERGIKAYVAFFYGTHQNYIYCEPKLVQEKDIRPNMGLSILYTLHSKASCNEWANRVSILIHKGVSLIDYMKCIILPEKLMAYESFQPVLTKDGLVCKTYRILAHRVPWAYNQTVFDLYMEYLKEEGYAVC